MRGITGTFPSLGLVSAALLAALLLAAMALAQPTDDRVPAAASESPQGADDNAVAGGDETAGSDGGVVLSPFDYEASESISEDASVSFPVDI